jgi:hypothetical protein
LPCRGQAIAQHVRASVYRRVREQEKIMPFLSFFEEHEQQAEKHGRDDSAKQGLLEGIQVVQQLRLPRQEKALLVRAAQVTDLELLRRVLKVAAR